MTPAKKEKCSIRHGYDAMNRIEEAGQLIEGLLADQPGREVYDDVTSAFMNFQMDIGQIGNELLYRDSPETVKRWIEPQRDVILAELQQRGLDQSADARHAFRKIDAVLSWVDDWPRA